MSNHSHNFSGYILSLIISSIAEVNSFLSSLNEIYLLKFHEIESDDKFVKYLIENSVKQKDINEFYNVPLRKIRKLSRKEE